jgi:hypothetical protein
MHDITELIKVMMWVIFGTGGVVGILTYLIIRGTARFLRGDDHE